MDPFKRTSRSSIARTAGRLILLVGLLVAGSTRAEGWKRHTIDRTSRGADGVRLADVNRDGHLDIATGWEQGGVVRLYLNPGQALAREIWPQVTVGNVKSPEDAVLVDLDQDGHLDVVSCCEGRTRTIFVHWSPSDSAQLLKAAAWKTEAIDVTAGKQLWMYALPMDVDKRHGPDLIVGSKGNGATVGWLQAPADPRNMTAWKFHPIYKAGWIMSLVAEDLDADGDLDVVVSDRKGKKRGVLWLENPGAEANRAFLPWKEHRIGADGMEVMFLTLADLNSDDRKDILCATWNQKIVYLSREAGAGVRFRSQSIENPMSVPHGKSVAVGDIDLDGRLDLVHSSNKGRNRRAMPAVTWLKYGQSTAEEKWRVADISGPQGVKFDLVELLDLDGDGDLDVLTCEEVDDLGVFWYENPQRASKTRK